MRCINFRFLCSPRKLRNFIILAITVILIVNFIHISTHEKPQQIASTTTIKRSNDLKIHTKLRTKMPCPAKLRLLILVSSNLGNTDRRTLIRKTWGPDNSLRTRWRTVFLLTENNNQKEKKIAEIESDLYGDIITGDYQESFFNMAFKVAMGFEWALKFCKFDYLLKVDDDIFVNTHGLLDYLELNTTLKTKLYSGNPMIGSPVLRTGRYAVKYESGEKRDDATNKTMFVPYSSGGGIILSNDVVSSVLDNYDLKYPLNIDDAYIGELASRAGVSLLVNSKNFKMYEDRCIYSPIAFVQHPAKGKCLEELHRRHVKYLLTGELETPPPPPPTKPTPKAPAPAKMNPPIAAKNSPLPQGQPPPKQAPTIRETNPVAAKNTPAPQQQAQTPPKQVGKAPIVRETNPVAAKNSPPPPKPIVKATAAPKKNVVAAQKPQTPSPTPPPK